MYLKTAWILFILQTFLIGGLFAQDNNQTLEVKFGTLGTTYYAGKSEIAERSRITKRQFVTKLKTDADAFRQFKSGRPSLTMGNVIVISSIIILYPGIDDLLQGDRPNQVLLLSGGLGAIGGAILIYYGCAKIRKSVDIYNSKKFGLGLNVGQSGVGIVMGF